MTPSALAGLVATAAESVDGAEVRRGRRRLEIDLADGSARVRLELVARYGAVLPDIARAVQERVADALTKMCSVKVEAVDVSVEEIR
jgi:uncharacterized alkaline shock family protein YloU